MIQNKIDNKIYIGRCLDFHKRTIGHKSELRNNIHHSFILQRAVNKHGIENFEFLMLEKCKPEECRDKEQFWINLLNPEYNLVKNSRGGFYGKRSIETIEKLRESKRKVDVYQFDLKGNFITKYRSISDAARAINKNEACHIGDVCRGKRNRAYGYLWSFTETPPIDNTLTIYQYDLNGNFIEEFNSWKKIAILFNTTAETVTKFIKNQNIKTKTNLKNFKWKINR